MNTKASVLALVGVGLAALGASCALPFWSLPADQGAGGSSGSSGSTSSDASSTSSGELPECVEPGAPMCGTSTEQCNDGGSFKLDGCNEACGYEVVQRMSDLAISPDAGPSFCVHAENRFGHAIKASLIGIVDQPVADNLRNGTLNVLTHFHCLSDLTGTNATGFTMGILDGFLDPAVGLWPSSPQPTGPAPEDWSFLANGAAISSGTETYQLSPASIVDHALAAGPSSIKLNFPLAGADGALTLHNAILHATIAPTTSQPGPASLNVAQDLMVFDQISATGQDLGLCGDITVQSLAQIAVPPLIAMGGTTVCTEGYAPCGSSTVVGPGCNSLLDVLVGGCTYAGSKVAFPTQPDVSGNASQATTLVAGADHKVIVPAGDDDGYSAYFTFAMLRQHIAGVSCASVDDCQPGQTCVANVCSPR